MEQVVDWFNEIPADQRAALVVTVVVLIWALVAFR